MFSNSNNLKVANKPYFLLVLILIGLLTVFTNTTIFGQSDLSRNINYLSPNALSIGMHGNTSVSLVSGTPNINIPVYSFKEGSINVPISLNYDASGVRPDKHPGWVGNGWSLSSGGTITREVVGKEDDYHFLSVNNGINQTSEIGYYYAHSELNQGNWTSSSFMEELYPYSPFFDIFYVPPRDYEADIFTFSVAGFSGKFFLGRDGGWHVESDPSIKVESYIKTGSLSPDVYILPNGIGNFTPKIRKTLSYFAGFKITLPNGRICYFGKYGPNEGSMNAVEWSHDPMNRILWETRTDAWHVSKIIDPFTQDSVLFQYTKVSPIMSVGRKMAFERVDESLHFSGVLGGIGYSEDDTEASALYTGRMIYPSYLQKIQGSKEELDFSISSTLELRYDFAKIQHNANFSAPDNHFGGPTNVNAQEAWPNNFFQPIQWFQLNSIKLKNRETQQELRSFNFGYTADATSRLNLLSFWKSGENPYVFDYNASSLPDYLTTATDHWGYHNGLSEPFLKDLYTPVNYGDAELVVTIADQLLRDYWQLREPSSAFMDAEILEKITYPTLGTTEFEFEPLYYDSYIKRNETNGTISVETNGNSGAGHHVLGYAGGLRVKKITDSPIIGNQIIKEYLYEGGILNSDYKYYWEGVVYNTDNIDYELDDFMTESFLPKSKGISHVTYSKVIEIQQGKGKTEYLFSNHDSNIDDNFIQTTHPVFSLNKPLEDRSLERGKLLQKDVYNENSTLLLSTVFNYQNIYMPDIYLFKSRNVQTDHRYINTFSGTIGTTELRIATAYQRSVSPNKLVSKTTNSYFYPNSGQPQVLTSTEEFGYDNQYAFNVVTSKTNSEGGKQIIETVFSGTLPNNAGTYTSSEMLAIKALRDNNALSIPIERIKYWKKLGGLKKVIESEYLEYKLFQNGSSFKPFIHKVWNTELSVPVSNFPKIHGVSGALAKSSYYTNHGDDLPSSEILHYDSKGNLVEIKASNDVSNVSIWNGRNQVVASIINASENECAFTSFESNSQSNHGWTYTGGTTSNSTGGKKGKILVYGEAVTKYNLPAGDYIISYWLAANEASIKVNGAIVETSGGGAAPFEQYEHTINLPNTINAVSLIGNYAIIDELRLYPKDGQMVSYTYDDETSLLLSKGDQNGVLSHFEYDNLQRLVAVRDHNDDFTKSYSYSIQSPITENYVEENIILKEGVSTLSEVANLNVGEVLTTKTFVDGLGRSMQISTLNASPSQKNIVKHIEYDEFGRQNKKFLPYSTGSSTGLYQANAKTYQSLFYGSLSNSYGYTESVFDDSPLNRIEKSSSPGENWKIGSGNEISYTYRSNYANEVRLLVASEIPNSYYPANSLKVSTVFDEDGNKKIVFTDLADRVVLQDIEGAKTYTVYDRHGRVGAVIPPLAFQKMETTGNYLYLAYPESVYSYIYDSRGRVIRKKVPGKDAEFMYYDKLDRLALLKDANGTKSFIKYDILSRPILSGIYHGSSLPGSGNYGLYESEFDPSSFPVAYGHGYTTTQAFPTTNYDVLTVNYYDHYDFDRDGVVDANEDYQVPTSNIFPSTYSKHTNGMLTASKTAVYKVDGFTIDSYLSSRSFYDDYGRVIESISDNISGQKDVMHNAYSFSGLLTHNKMKHRAVQDDLIYSKILEEEFDYDHAGRLLKTYLTIDGGDKKLISKLDYNERGELKRKSLGGNTLEDDFLQKVDYKYNIRGWLTRINNPNDCGNFPYDLNKSKSLLKSGGGPGDGGGVAPGDILPPDLENNDDIFSMGLFYDKERTDLSITPKYNGNINATEWRDGCDQDIKGYGFDYDNRSQITKALFSEKDAYNVYQKTGTYNLNYVDYDLNGNILALIRNGVNGINMDNLWYTIGDNNQLDILTEVGDLTAGFKSSQNQAGFSYDAAGNMIRDDHKALDIHYNSNNLPFIMAYDNLDSMRIIYSADGVKLVKETKANTANNWARKEYMGAFEYGNGLLEAIYHNEGRLTRISNSNSYQFEYNLKDHLGNTRATFVDLNNDGEIKEDDGEVLQRNHYYPFGMNMEGNWNTISGTENKYQYNGKEMNDEFGLGWLDYGARWYDPSIARWNSVDPLAEKYSSWTPYHYVMNRSMNLIDPDGRHHEDPNEDCSDCPDYEHSVTYEPIPMQRDNFDDSPKHIDPNLPYTIYSEGVYFEAEASVDAGLIFTLDGVTITLTAVELAKIKLSTIEGEGIIKTEGTGDEGTTVLHYGFDVNKKGTGASYTYEQTINENTQKTLETERSSSVTLRNVSLFSSVSTESSSGNTLKKNGIGFSGGKGFNFITGSGSVSVGRYQTAKHYPPLLPLNPTHELE